MQTDLVALDLARDLIQRRIDEAHHDHLAAQVPSAAIAPSGLVAKLLSPLRLRASLADRIVAVRHVAAAGLRDLAARVDSCGAVDPGYVLVTRSR